MEYAEFLADKDCCVAFILDYYKNGNNGIMIMEDSFSKNYTFSLK